METCRLCFSNQHDQLNIFDASRNITDVLRVHIGEVNEDDELPKTVCADCWTRTSDFHEFYCFIKSAQLNYLNSVVIKSEVDIDQEDIKPTDFVAVEQSEFVVAGGQEENALEIKNDNLSDLNEHSPSEVIQKEDLVSTAVNKKPSKRTKKVKSNKNVEESKVEKKKDKWDLAERSFVCDICGKSYRDKNCIKSHMYAVHSKPKAMSNQCSFCPERFAMVGLLRKHESAVHSSVISDIIEKQMNEINARVPSDSEMEEVISKHFDMNCDICGEELKSLTQAEFHYMDAHKKDYYLKCCGIKLLNKTKISNHVLWHLDPNLYKCKICTRCEKTKDNFRIHILKHFKSDRVQCSMCKHELAAGSYTHHMKNVHGIVTVKEKKVIAKGTIGDPSIVEENVEFSDSNISEYLDMTCDICKVALDSLQHAKLHYAEEHNKNGYVKCCGIKFKELSQLNDHFKVHKNPDIYKCHICGKTLPLGRSYSSHMSRHKAVENRLYVCQVCNKPYISQSKLDEHRVVHEKGVLNFQCEHCSKRFATKSGKRVHIIRFHSQAKEKSEICEFCGKPFVSRCFLLAHVRQVHSGKGKSQEKFQCQICDAWLCTQYSLKYHMRRHTEGPQKCSQCDKVSPNRAALLCHIKNVHTDTNFKCQICNKSFKAAPALKDHVATHTGEKLYKCSYCPESFIWRPNMYSHQKKAHPDEWNADKNRKKNEMNSS